MSETMSFYAGKYTLTNNNGRLKALRHGEPWDRCLVGDGLVLAMFQDAYALKKKNDELATALQDCLDAIRVAFDAEEDPFGAHHNAAVDAFFQAEHLLDNRRKEKT